MRQREALTAGLVQRASAPLDRETMAWVKAQTGEGGKYRRDAVAGTGRGDPQGRCRSGAAFAASGGLTPAGTTD